MANDEIVRRARRAIGARFRPQGRSPAIGLDCVGLAAFAAGAAMQRIPRDYAMRGEPVGRLEVALWARGFMALPPGEAEQGDLLIARAGPGQMHVAVLTDIGFIHADAGLGRVVERPGSLPWPVLSAWRVPGTSD